MAALAANRTSVPQIWIGQKHIGGCDDLKVMVYVPLGGDIPLGGAPLVVAVGGSGGDSCCGCFFCRFCGRFRFRLNQPIETILRLRLTKTVYEACVQ